MNKAGIRKLMRERRRSLDADAQFQAGQALARNASSLRVLKSARRVALYLTSDGEIDTASLVEYCFDLGKEVFAPVMLGNRPDSILRFAPWRHHRPWIKNRYSIAEPDEPASQCLAANRIDLIFLPLVAFDQAGRRLGMGGGFYDRTLAARRQRQSFARPRLIGIAHECQRLERIPVDSWDVPLDGILTDQHFYGLRTP